MTISKLLVLLFLMPAAILTAAPVQEFEGVEYTLPNGWQAVRQDNNLIIKPDESVSELGVALVLIPPMPLNDFSFRSWFDSFMASSLLVNKSKVIADGEVISQEAGAIKKLTNARVIQENAGSNRIYLYHAISLDDRAALVMGVAVSQKALEKYATPIDSFFQNMTFSYKPPMANVSPPPDIVPVGTGELVLKSGLVNGKPQGLFIGVSVLSGNPVFLLFLNNGRVFSQLPPGGLNRVDWDYLVKNYPNSTGQWSVSNGKLALRWRNGGVWEDTMTPTPQGMRFNGKSYSAAATVDLGQLAGTFEGSQSTAWLNSGGGGPSLTRATTIRLDGKGGFSFSSATGGDVGNAVAYGSIASSGSVTIEGYDALFRHKDGRTERMSMFRFPDDDSFIMNGTYYIKKK